MQPDLIIPYPIDVGENVALHWKKKTTTTKKKVMFPIRKCQHQNLKSLQINSRIFALTIIKNSETIFSVSSVTGENFEG